MKAVFFDVDGTLIDCVEKKIPASSIKAIEELRKNGYKVALATGRDINSIRGIKDLDISVFDAYVLNNGAAIYDNTLRCIKDFPFLREDVEKILEYCNNKNMSLIQLRALIWLLKLLIVWLRGKNIIRKKSHHI